MKNRFDPRVLDHKGEPEEWAAIRRRNERDQNEVNRKAVKHYGKSRKAKDS